MNKVSIIIPVYNTGKDMLSRCIHCIKEQTYLNIEVILVDDGSKEEIAGYLDEVKEENTDFIVIHRQNGGPSRARNSGLERMTGDYFCFIDADDYLSENYIEQLVTSMDTTGSDIAFANMIVISDKCNEAVKKGENKQECLIKMNDNNRYGILQQCYHNVPSQLTIESEPLQCMSNELWIQAKIWGRLYRTKTFRSIRFEENVIYSEDHIYCLDTLLASKLLSFVRNTFYYYCINDNSITRTKYSYFPIDYYVAYFDALYCRLLEWPNLFNGKFSGMMYGIILGRTQGKTFMEAYREVKNILSNRKIHELSMQLNYDDCAHLQEKRIRYCLIKKRIFLFVVFTRLCKWKNRICKNLSI